MPERSHEQRVIGIAWFDREQWERMIAIAPDRNRLDDTFEEWEQNANKAARNFEDLGQRVEKVPINVEEWLSWCKAKGLAPHSGSRAQFVTSLMQEKYRAKS